MHFSIPDTQEIVSENGSSFMGYNVHINGILHCVVRFKQLHNLHEQLCKEFDVTTLPVFPPKKYLPLTEHRLEERRMLLEKYVQSVGQDPRLISSDLLNGFLLSAQQETNDVKRYEVNIDIYLMNNFLIPLNVFTTDRSGQVLKKVCWKINLPSEHANFFSLYLFKIEQVNSLTILRKLQNFESPYISHNSIQEPNKLVLRKSYWDPNYDLQLMSSPVGLHLLYVQTLADVERGWTLCNREKKKYLTYLQEKNVEKEYVDLARTLKFYGFIQFKPCYCDYPNPRTWVLISMGNQELNFRVNLGDANDPREGYFKITRMRCWRVTALNNMKEYSIGSDGKNPNTDMEFSFEYLMSKDKLQWITITSSQAILLSVCLQSMVDELLFKKNGPKKKIENDKDSWLYMKRDGTVQLLSSINQDIDGNTNGNSTLSNAETFSIKKLQEKFSVISFKSGKEFVENHAFEGIGDEDL